MFPTGASAKAKALRQECAWPIEGKEKRPPWLVWLRELSSGL